MFSRRRTLLVATLLIVSGLLTCWVFGSIAVAPSSYSVPPATTPAKDLKLVSLDGLSLAATYWPGRRANSPAVLMLHGNGASREAMRPNASWLAEQGYAVLTLDFRGHGQSTPAQKSYGLFEAKDAAAGLAWLRDQQSGAKVAALGISLGGAAMLLGENGPLPVDALILQAVYPDIRHAIRNRIASITTSFPAIFLEPLLSFQSRLRLGVLPSRLSPLAALRRYSGPVLIIGGADDLFTPSQETKALYDAASGRKTMWLAKGLDHAGVSALKSPDYREHLLDFLLREIGEP